jgi:hypothetical protein
MNLLLFSSNMDGEVRKKKANHKQCCDIVTMRRKFNNLLVKDQIVKI